MENQYLYFMTSTILLLIPLVVILSRRDVAPPEIVVDKLQRFTELNTVFTASFTEVYAPVTTIIDKTVGQYVHVNILNANTEGADMVSRIRIPSIQERVTQISELQRLVLSVMSPLVIERLTMYYTTAYVIELIKLDVSSLYSNYVEELIAQKREASMDKIPKPTKKKQYKPMSDEEAEEAIYTYNVLLASGTLDDEESKQFHELQTKLIRGGLINESTIG